eukprot:3726716-Prymnesium_polylepis.1
MMPSADPRAATPLHWDYRRTPKGVNGTPNPSGRHSACCTRGRPLVVLLLLCVAQAAANGERPVAGKATHSAAPRDGASAALKNMMPAG